MAVAEAQELRCPAAAEEAAQELRCPAAAEQELRCRAAGIAVVVAGIAVVAGSAERALPRAPLA
jgi:hypothetical protein